jgi:hypothetical protein
VGFLVEKRDGRREWLRATKLARSIRLALHAAGTADDWLGTDLAAAVLAGLRARGDQTLVRTAAIADAVTRVLIAAGHADAAAIYASVRIERERRHAVLLAAAVSTRPASPAPASRHAHHEPSDARRDP